MKKNNKGFFLAETIVMIALVTTVIAFLYPNVSKLYENYNNRIKYHDQTEDLYFLRAVYGYLTARGGKIVLNDDELVDITAQVNGIFDGENGLIKLFVTGYMETPKIDINDYSGEDFEPSDLNKYLHRLKKTNYEPNAYRLIGIFENNRYASIKIAGIDVTKDGE